MRSSGWKGMSAPKSRLPAAKGSHWRSRQTRGGLVMARSGLWAPQECARRRREKARTWRRSLRATGQTNAIDGQVGAAGQSVVVGPSRRDARVERFDIEIGENDRRRGKSTRARARGWEVGRFDHFVGSVFVCLTRLKPREYDNCDN